MLNVSVSLYEKGLLCWGFLFPLSFLIQISGVNIVMTDRMVVIHPQTSEFFNSPLTKCCFASCFRWGFKCGMNWNISWNHFFFGRILSTMTPGEFYFYEETCSVLEKESPITNIIRLCCRETFYYFSWNQVYKILGIMGFSLSLFVQFDFF